MKLPLPIATFLSRLRMTKAEPVRDWHLLLLVSILALLLSVVWNVLSFLQVIADKEPPQAAVEEVSLDADVAARVEEVFRMRAAEEARYRSEYRFVDPSR